MFIIELGNGHAVNWIGLDQMTNHRRLETRKSTHSYNHLFERINVIVV